MKKKLKLIFKFILISIIYFTQGCVSPIYYFHVSYNHLKILASEKKVADIIESDKVSPELKKKLQFTQKIRAFASSELLLPDNNSFKLYVNLKKPVLMWNVTCAPELSITPVTWNYIFAGKASYRGFYDKQLAENFAATYKSKGFDTDISEVPAYSTLGWFSDPLFSSYIFWDDTYIAALMFHELAHQKIYVKGDTDFNESFAETVAEIGIQLWFKKNKREKESENYFIYKELRKNFEKLVTQNILKLNEVYSNKQLSYSKKKNAKSAILKKMNADFEIMKEKNPKYKIYNKWFENVNNAKLSHFSTYTRLKPFFKNLYRKNGNNMNFFLKEVLKISKMPYIKRKKYLKSLACNKDT